MSRSNLITSRRAFTVIELSVVLVIIALLAGILIVGVREALRTTRGTAEKQFVSVLKLGVEQFREQFGVVPPLVDDSNPIDTGNGNLVRIAGDSGNRQDVLKFLSYEITPAAPRWSELTLPYYIVGVCGKDVDGVEGLGFTAVERSGHFSRRGKPIEPFFAAEREQTRLFFPPPPYPGGTTAVQNTRLWDKYVRPRGRPIRYYRWLPTYFDRTNVTGGAQVGDIKDPNVPFAVGDPMKNTLLRSAAYAVVSAGPNLVFGDEAIADIRLELGSAVASLSDAEARDVARSDNIVEVGQ